MLHPQCPSVGSDLGLHFLASGCNTRPSGDDDSSATNKVGLRRGGGLTTLQSDEEDEDFSKNQDSATPQNSASHEDAKLLIETSQRMHLLLMKQFQTKEQVDLYTNLLKDGVGRGKYSSKEQAAFGVLYHEHENEYCDSDDSTVLNYSQLSANRSKKTMKEKVEEVPTIMRPMDLSDFSHLYPIRPATVMRHSRARLHINFVLLYKRTSVYKIVQIMRIRGGADKV